MENRTQITRRMLLGAAVGLAGLVIPGEAAIAQDSGKGSPEPGLLARGHLSPKVIALMTSTTRLYGIHPGGPSHKVLSDSEEAQRARRLADLLLRDDTWAIRPSMEANGRIWGRKSVWEEKFQPDFVFTFPGITFPGVVVSLCPNAHAIHFEWTTEATHVARTNHLLFDPIGEELTAFLKDFFPDDAGVQVLTFAPRPVDPLPIPTRPPQIPPDVWAQIVALKPGMTRADLLKVFDGEGGIRTRQSQLFIRARNREERNKNGQALKIYAEFAPANVPLLWQGGQGYFKNPEDEHRSLAGETSGDLITALSPVFWGYMVID